MSVMEMIDCPECSKPVSDMAPTCPNCGVVIASMTAAKKKRTLGSHILTISVGVILASAILMFWALRSVTSNRAAPPSAGFAASLRQPQVLVNERIQLNEGQSEAYSFSLNSDARIQVEVNAQPKQVTVMLMNVDDFQNFRQANQKLFGGQYSYRQALSGQNVLQMDKTQVLPQ
jgi:hypothetical protein